MFDKVMNFETFISILSIFLTYYPIVLLIYLLLDLSFIIEASTRVFCII